MDGGWATRWRHPSVVAGAAWFVAYCVAWATGERFSASYLAFGWQIVPWDILSTDPLRSLWYLHIQPPGWNALLGITAWISPLPDALSLQLVMASFGVLLAGACAAVASQLGLGRRAAVVVALVATLHPEVLRTAFEPLYELPVGALLMLVIWALGRAAGERAPVLGFGMAIAAATAVVLTRSLYHPVWLVAVGLAAWWLARPRVSRRQIAVAALVPIVLIGGWMVKNEALYGRATLSSWFGMNLQRAVIPVLDEDDLIAMHTAGDVSDIALIGPFERYELYADSMEPCTPRHAHRSVSEPMRTTDAFSPNFNYECFLPVFDRAGADAWAVLRAHPDAWLEGRLWSLRTTFAVAAQPRDSESVVMRALAWTYAVVRVDVRFAISTESWGTPFMGKVVTRPPFGLVPVAAYLALVLLALRRGWGLVRSRSTQRVRDVVIVAAGSVAVWTVVVGAVGELGEQARFRTMADPAVWTVVGALLVQWVGRLTSARRAGRVAPLRSEPPGGPPPPTT